MIVDTTEEIEYYDTTNSFRKANDIVYDLDTDITYRIFVKDIRFKKIIKDIIKGGWYDKIKEHIVHSMNSYFSSRNPSSFDGYFDYDDDKTVFSYLLFQTLYNKESLYIVYHEFNEEIYVISHAKFVNFITKDITIPWNITFISRVLLDIKTIFYENPVFKYIINKNEAINKELGLNDKIDLYSRFLEDIKNIKSISEEFENCRIRLNFKDGEPCYMEAEAKTTNTDFKEWKEKLGNERKIEENVHDGRAVSLTVTKKFQYKSKNKAKEGSDSKTK